MLRCTTLLELIHTFDYPINLHPMQAIPPLKAQAGTRGNLPDKLARLARSPFGQHYSSKSAGSYRKKGLSESSTLPQRHSAVGISNFGIPIRKLWLIGAALVLISLAVATTTYAAEVIVDCTCFGVIII